MADPPSVKPKWEVITGFIDDMKKLPEFQDFTISYSEATSILPLDYLDHGIDLNDQGQLYSFVYGVLLPVRMLVQNFKDDELSLNEVLNAYLAFSGVLSSLKQYLPSEYFARYYEE